MDVIRLCVFVVIGGVKWVRIALGLVFVTAEIVNKSTMSGINSALQIIFDHFQLFQEYVTTEMGKLNFVNL